MADNIRRLNAPAHEVAPSVTQRLEALALPISESAESRDGEPARQTALLICRDGDLTKWASRWLMQSELEPLLCNDAERALDLVRSAQPDVIIVEAGMLARDGAALISRLHRDSGLGAPVIAMCSNARELADALDAGVFDVVRKPYEWRLLAQRARHAATMRRLESTLRDARQSLAGAIDVADLARRQLRSRESYEPVTGLPNRKKFVDLLKRTMAAADRDRNQVAVFVIGFNRFRLVVEAMGQERADLVLTEVGNSLSEYLLDASSTQTHTTGLRTAAAASIDHARFAMMLTCSHRKGELAAMQQSLIERLSRPVQIAGQTVHLPACVGVAIYPQDAGDVDSLLQRADNAMRDAQSRGGGFRFHCAATDAAAARKLKLEHLLHEALDSDGLRLAYQPIIDLTHAHASGAEALLRWYEGGKEFVGPGEFVPIAEESGLMDRIGAFVLEHACKQLRAWQAAGRAPSRMCVNVSKAQLLGDRLRDTVARCLAKYDLAPSSLELELSERGVLSRDDGVIDQLHALKDLGVRLSLDDFGTGDSAIVYLRELPIDAIKIDQSYVQALKKNSKDAAIVSAMVALGQQLGLSVIAEGVETAEQLAALRSLGCTEYQGFIASAPLAECDFLAFLQRARRAAETD